MHRIFIMFLVLVGVIALSNCAGNPYPPPQHVTVTVTNAFTSIQVGTAAVTLNAVVKGDKHNAGVNWLLTVANVNCSPACGTLTSPGGPKSLSAVYTPPATTPLNQSATISAVSADDSAGIFAFDFTIQASISVTITNKLRSNWLVAPAWSSPAPSQTTIQMPASPGRSPREVLRARPHAAS
jgi:hypothetical protein